MESGTTVMADPRHGSFSEPLDHRLQNWIEKSEQNQRASTLNHQQHGFASNLYHTCVDLYCDIWNAYRIGKHKSSHYRTQIRDSLSQFLLWGETVENGKLDAVLDSSDDLRDCVLEVLSNITETLIKGANELDPVLASPINNDIETPLGQAKAMLEKTRIILGEEAGCTDSDSDTGSDGSSSRRTFARAIKCFVEDTATQLTCLMDLLPTIEHTAEQRDLSGRVVVSGPHNLAFRVSAPAEQYVRQICDKFPCASTGLAERLGEANWQRFQRIRAREQENLENVTGTKGTLHLAKSAFAPVSRFHDSGLGSSIPASSQYAATVASHTSYLSSQADKDSGRLRVPSMPKEAIDGLPFDCSICGKNLTKIRTRVDWKLHVFHDLQPYICCAPASECRDSLVTFSSRKLWADHEFSQHHAFDVWDCKGCLKEFDSGESYIEHLKLDHHVSSDDQIMQVWLNSAKRGVAISVEDQQCPLCLQKGWENRRLLIKHLGGHMEEIALLALPRDVDSDEDEDTRFASSVVSADSPVLEMDTSGVSIQNAQRWVDTKSQATQADRIQLPELPQGCDLICPFHSLDGCYTRYKSKFAWKVHVCAHLYTPALPATARCFYCAKEFKLQSRLPAEQGIPPQQGVLQQGDNVMPQQQSNEAQNINPEITKEDNETINRLAAKMAEETPPEDIVQIRANLDKIPAEQKEALKAKSVDVLASFFRSQAQKEWRRRKLATMMDGVDTSGSPWEGMLDHVASDHLENVRGTRGERADLDPVSRQQMGAQGIISDEDLSGLPQVGRPSDEAVKDQLDRASMANEVEEMNVHEWISSAPREARSEAVARNKPSASMQSWNETDSTTPVAPGMAITKQPISLRKAPEPPKNDKDEIYCDHPDCAKDPPTFRRPFAWNQHMDKHDRPYKCTEPGCKRLLGFTYSGGLLRHQREVHKMNVSAKGLMFCHYQDCKRHTKGFVRKYNLNNHIRRCHENHFDLVPESEEHISDEASDVASNVAALAEDDHVPRRQVREQELSHDAAIHAWESGMHGATLR